MGALIVNLKLAGDGFGEPEERERIWTLADDLAEAVETQTDGKFDGDEFGEGECRLFMYGPDPDAMFSAVEQILRESSLTAGAHALKCYGEPNDDNLRVVRIDFP